MARLAAFVLMFMLMLPGSAWAESWSPVGVVPGAWTVTVADEVGGSGRLNTNETCRMTFSWWQREDGVSLIAKTYTCEDFSTAAKFAGLLASYDDRESRPPVFDRRIDVAQAETVPDVGFVVRRQWAQDNLVLVVQVLCGDLDWDGCFDLADPAAESYAAAQPGAPRDFREPAQAFISAVIAVLFTVWLMFVGIPGLIRLILRARYPKPVLPWWNDVDHVVGRVLLRSVGWGMLVGIRRVCYSLIVVMLFMRGRESAAWPWIAGFAAVAIGCWWWAKRLWLPVFGTSRWSEFARNTRSRKHLIGGLFIWGVVRAGAAYLLLISVLAIYVEATGGFDSPVLDKLTMPADTSEFSAYHWFLVVVVGVGAEGAGGLVYMIALGGLTFLLLLDQVGKRLLTPKFDLAGDGRDEILYLRNFGDDRMRLRASRLSRRGVLGRLSPWRTRPFELVVLSRLRLTGDAYAVNHPKRLAFTQGVPKATLGDEWLADVTSMAERALFVVVSVTPKSIGEDGFLQELKMLSNTLSHQRIMIVIGSWRRKVLVRNWLNFLAATRHLPLFASLDQRTGTLATQVMVYLPGIGWEAWGARTRSEWSYAVALDLALRRALPIWRPGQEVSPEPSVRRGG